VADLIDSSLVVIEGEVRSMDDTLETLSKRKKNSKECQNKTNDSNNLFQVSLYIPCVSINRTLLKFRKRYVKELIYKLNKIYFISHKITRIWI